MKGKRIRASQLKDHSETVREHAEVWRRFKRGEVDGVWATRASGILTNHRNMLESTETEARLGRIEQRIEGMIAGASPNVVTFKGKASA
jgi:hypothetical protein